MALPQSNPGPKPKPKKNTPPQGPPTGTAATPKPKPPKAGAGSTKRDTGRGGGSAPPQGPPTGTGATPKKKKDQPKSKPAKKPPIGSAGAVKAGAGKTQRETSRGGTFPVSGSKPPTAGALDRRKGGQRDSPVKSAQRTVKAVGAPGIVVDGKYGPKSQIASRVLGRGVRETRLAERPLQRSLKKERQAAEALYGAIIASWFDKEDNSVTARRLRLENQALAGVARYERGRILSARRDYSFERGLGVPYLGQWLREHPEKADAKDLRRYFFDPQIGVWTDKSGDYILRDTENIAMMQRWLQSKGHGGDHPGAPGLEKPKGYVPVTGEFDERTWNAFISEQREAARVERTQKMAALTEVFFRSGIMSGRSALPGMTVGFKPGAPGIQGGYVVPIAPPQFGGVAQITPEMLYQHLNLGGPKARITLNYLITQAKNIAFGQEVETALKLEENRRFASLKEQAYRNIAAARAASEDEGWFDGVVNALEWPFRKAAESAVAAWYDIKDPFSAENLNPLNLFRDDPEALAAVQDFKEAHPIAYMTLSIALDPLWLVPGAGAVRMGKYAFRTKQTVFLKDGYLVSRTGRVTLVPPGLKTTIVHVNEMPAWVQRTHNLATKAWDVFANDAVHFPGIYRALELSRKATALKNDVLESARQSVADAARLSYRLPARLVGKTAPKKLPKDGDAVLTRINEEFGRATSVAVRKFLIAASTHKLAVYAHDGPGSPFSEIFAMLDAGQVNRINRDVLNRIAREQADAVLQREISLTPGLSRAEKKAIWDAVYRDTLSDSPLYRSGVGDPEILRKFERRRDFQLALWREHTVPIIHQEVLKRAGSEALYDSTTGVYLHAGSDLVKDLKSKAARQFDDERLIRVFNPNHKRFFDAKTKDQLMMTEIKWLYSRHASQKAVAEAAGNPIPEHVLNKRLNHAEAHIRDAWRKKGRRWTDTRPSRTIPAIYARHLSPEQRRVFLEAHSADPITDELLGIVQPTDLFNPDDLRNVVIDEGLNFGDIENEFEALAGWSRMAPVEEPIEGGLPYTDDLNELVNRVTGLQKEQFDLPLNSPHLADLDEALEEVKTSLAPILDEMGVNSFDDLVEGMDIEAMNRLNQHIRDFQGALQKREQFVRSIADTMLSRELLHDGAVWQALRFAQFKPFRMAYYSMAAVLGTWRFITLPLRPGWVVRNVVDNWVKVVLQGVIDPRIWFKGAGKAIDDTGIPSVFAAGVDDLFAAAHFLSKITQTEDQFLRSWAFVEDVLWGQPVSRLKKIFEVHDVPMPESLLEHAQFAREGDLLLSRWHPDAKGKIAVNPRTSGKLTSEQYRLAIEQGLDPTFIQRNLAHLASFHDRAWTLMGSKPENFYKRVLYRDQYIKAIKAGFSDHEAAMQAWRSIEHTLFDYSKITVIEDNFRFFFPFIQFWRKNLTFWLKEVADHPAGFLSGITSYSEMLQDVNSDLPSWMRRYLSLEPVADVVSRVPGLKWMAPHLAEARIDPVGFFSFSPLYRAFKSVNPNLSPQQAGMKFIGGLIDGLNDWGLTLSPWIRKPLEAMGVASTRTWQKIFPATSLVEIFTMRFMRDRFPNGFDPEAWIGDKLWDAMGEEHPDAAAEKFEYYVNLEIAAQGARGEVLSREAAARKVQDFLFFQGVLGYFAGTYVRQVSPENVAYYRMAEDMAKGQLDFRDMTPDQRTLYRLFQRRGWDAKAFDKYVEMIPLIQTYYSLTYLEGQEWLKQHPGLKPYVEEWYGFRGDGAKLGWVQNMILSGQTGAARKLYDLVEKIDLDYEVTRDAFDLLATPKLKRYWALNDVPPEFQTKMLRAQYYNRLIGLTKEFYKIPEGKDAWKEREGFLKEHPDLARWFQTIDSQSGDIDAITWGVSQALRDRYFEILDNNGGEPDFDKAIRFLQRFPFAFDPTSQKAKYREIAKVGHYSGYTPYSRGRMGGGGGGLSQYAIDYRAAKGHLDHFFNLLDRNNDRAYAWLEGNSVGARAVRAYFDKYADPSKLSQKAKDYRAAKPFLNKYFAMSDERKRSWLAGGSKGAKIVLAYFKKYVKKEYQQSQKAKDYLAAKKWLDFYFSMTPEQRGEWLRTGAKGTKIVLAYFEEYSDKKTKSQQAADYEAVKDLLDIYWSLPEDQRSEFVRNNPELERYFDKYADEGGQTQHSIDYLAAKPWLDIYFGQRDQGAHQARAWLNSGVQGTDIVRDYFAKYSTQHQFERSFRPTPGRIPTGVYRNARRGARVLHEDSDAEFFTSSNPELSARLQFWQDYFDLPPDQRPLFVQQYAEEYGIFVYGSLGEQETLDRMYAWMREQFNYQGDERSALYSYVKPFYNFWKTLDPAEKDLFRRANPELDEFLDKYASQRPTTGDASLDSVIEQYFQLPRGSRQRSILIVEHPELQAWFNENSQPDDSAMRMILDEYFNLTGTARSGYAAAHPEIAAYFEKRRDEKRAENQQFEAFDRADPRLRDFFAKGETEVYRDAYIRQAQIDAARVREIALTDRRQRVPIAV